MIERCQYCGGGCATLPVHTSGQCIGQVPPREQARKRVIEAAREAVVYAPTDLRLGRLSKLAAALAALDHPS